MSLSPEILQRLSALELPTHAFQEVLAIVAAITAEDEARRAKQRERKQRSRDSHGTVTGQGRDSHSDKKEKSPIPPKEKTIPQVSLETFGSHPKRVRVAYSPAFEAFWKPYPRTPIMAKDETWKEWKKLSPEDQAAATAAVPRYVAWLKSKPDHATVHACRFLSQRRFDGFGEPTEATATVGVPLQPGSDQFKAWLEHFPRKSIQHSLMLRSDDTGQPYYAPTEWPPHYASVSNG